MEDKPQKSCSIGKELRTWLEREKTLEADNFHEISDLAGAVTILLKNKGYEDIPWLSRSAVLYWGGIYSQTRRRQTAFFVPFLFKYDDGSASPQGYCMVIAEDVVLMFQTAEEVAELIHQAVSSGNCWVPGY